MSIPRSRLYLSPASDVAGDAPDTVPLVPDPGHPVASTPRERARSSIALAGRSVSVLGLGVDFGDDTEFFTQMQGGSPRL